MNAGCAKGADARRHTTKRPAGHLSGALDPATVLRKLFRSALAAVVLSCAVAFAKPPETTITVSVTNQHDKPVENAAVILDFLGSHQITKLGKRKPIHWEVRTNLEGVAHFPPVPQGTVQLQVITKDYQTYGKKIDVDTEEKKLDIKLNPPQNQYSAHGPLKPADQTATKP